MVFVIEEAGASKKPAEYKAFSGLVSNNQIIQLANTIENLRTQRDQIKFSRRLMPV